MSVHTATTQEIFEDERGTRWIVVGRWDEPVVVMKEITLDWNNELAPRKLQGGISGLMWSGFKKIADAPR